MFSWLKRSLESICECLQSNCAFFNFKLHHDKKKWQVIQHLIQNCGLLFQYENVCIACSRPSKLSFDDENLLHADGEPALQFIDGYGIYANHGKSPFNNW